MQNIGSSIKKLQVAHDITVGSLRKMIADAFRLPFNGFQMQANQKIYEIEDDDFLFKNILWVPQISVTPYQGYNNETLQSWIAHNTSYINHLFLLLSKENTAYVDIVWDLMSSIPPNHKMLSDIEGLNIICNTEVAYFAYFLIGCLEHFVRYNIFP